MRKLAKVLGMITIAVLLLGGVIGLTVAQEAVVVSINAPDEVEEDSDFTAIVDISEVVDLNAAQYDISFDDTLLRLDDITPGLIDTTEIPVLSNEISPGTFRVVNSLGLEMVSGSGYLAVLHFHAIGSACQTSPIDLSDGILSGWEGEIEATWMGDSVHIMDAAPPTVVSTTPGADETGVALDAVVSATFSEDIQEGDNFAGIAIIGATGVSAGITGDTLTIAHDDFAYDITYEVAIPAGAVEDLAGNPNDEYSWSFTTTSAPPEAVVVSINAPDEVEEDSDFTATVDISEVVDLNAAQYDISFDDTLLRLDDITPGLIDTTEIPVLSNEISPGTFRVVNSLGLEMVSGSGYLAVLHFHAIGSACQTSPIDLSDGILSGWEGEIEATWMGDSVHIGITRFTTTLSEGWNLLSTPILLDADSDSMLQIFDNESVGNIEIAYGWDAGEQNWFQIYEDYELVPLFAIYVKVKPDALATAQFIPCGDYSAPPSRALVVGLNLIGPAPALEDSVFPAMPLDQALISIEEAEGGLTGYTMVISPGLNQPGWGYANVPDSEVPDLLPYKGYWVVMENPDTLYGFSTTPIQ